MKVRASYCLLLAALTANGCSMVLVDGPQKESSFDSRSKVTCTTSYAMPILDTVVMTAALAAATYNITRYEDHYGNGSPSLALVVNEAALGALFGASAIVGVARVNECRATRPLRAVRAPTP